MLADHSTLAASREWLEADGLGGFASGTATGIRTRRYHALLLYDVIDHLEHSGLGHVSEIADAEAPHAPRGCPWQAWSVGEALWLDRVRRRGDLLAPAHGRRLDDPCPVGI